MFDSYMVKAAILNTQLPKCEVLKIWTNIKCFVYIAMKAQLKYENFAGMIVQLHPQWYH